jgi:hypothetical protein
VGRSRSSPRCFARPRPLLLPPVLPAAAAAAAAAAPVDAGVVPDRKKRLQRGGSRQRGRGVAAWIRGLGYA